MKNWIYLILLLLSGSISFAQTTPISATVVDSDGTAWANGSWSLQFLPNNDNPNVNIYNQNGVALLPTVMFQKGVLNSGGAFSFNVYTNSTVTPIGSSWKITVCPNASAPCGFYTFSTVSTAPVDISSALTSTIPAPRFQALANTFGYIDAEAVLQLKSGATYWNVTSSSQRCYNGSIWGNCGSGGGGGNPAGGTKQVQWNNAGVFGASSAFTFDPVTNTTFFLSNEGVLNADQWQTTPGSNDGISRAMSTLSSGGLINSPPAYGNTEQYTFASPIPNSLPSTLWNDTRAGKNIYVYNNPAISGSYGDRFNPPEVHYFNRSGNAAPSVEYGVQQTSLILYDFSIVDNNSMPGYSFGGPWMVPVGQEIIQNTNGSGISEGLYTELHKHGIGDTVAVYGNVFSEGGSRAPSDEGVKSLSGTTTETTNTFSAPCATGCTTGSTQVKLTIPNCPITNINGGNGCIMGTQRYLIDTTAGPTATTVSAIVPGLNSTMSAVTVAATVPVSTAWGTLASTIMPSINIIVASPYYQSMTFNVNVSSGTFTAPGLGCFSSKFQEQALITAVGTPSGGVQSVTVNVHNAEHDSGSYFFEGGMCGNNLEFTSYTINGLRYLLDIVGSTDAHTLQVIRWFNGVGSQVTGWAQLNTANSMTGTITLSNLSGTGTTVTATYTGGTLGVPSNYNGSTFVISGASDSVFNANCTNAKWTSLTTLTCTNTAVNGHTSTSATASLGINGANIWPVAQAWDVQNNSLTPVSMDGSITLGPNNVPFTVGHTIEEPHDEAGQFNGGRLLNFVQNPGSIGDPLQLEMLGPGATGGGLSIGSRATLNLQNIQPDTYYQGMGGFNIAMNWVNHQGPYNIANNYDHGPQSGSSGFDVIRPPASQLNDVNYCYNYFNLSNLSGANTLNECPNAGTMTWSMTGAGTFKMPKLDLSSIGTLNTPVFTVSTLGGLVSGQGENYAPYSQNIAGPTWRVTGTGTGTATCASNDDLGNPACTLVSTGGTGTFNWDDNNGTGGYVALTLNATYFVHARMKGAVGGESVFLGADATATNYILTTTWTEYCATVIASNGGSNLQNFASFNVGFGATINVSNLTVSPLSCGPLLVTTNNQFTTPTIANHTNTFDFGAITLNNNAIGSPGGLPGPLDGSGHIPAGQIAGGGGGGGISNIQITTGVTPVPANTCSGVTSSAMTGLLTTSSIIPPTPTSSTIGVAGWDGANPGLTFSYYVTSGNFNWAICNGTVSPITPGGSITWNVGAN